ncbi:hypothetical protein IMAU60055_02866 [Lactiplantibacillus plantarum]|nr:hypothetical protein [Lactiplantibacillus plantarum]
MGCLLPNALNIDCPGVSQQLLNFFDFFALFWSFKKLLSHLPSSAITYSATQGVYFYF